MSKKYNDSPPLAPTTRPNCEASQSTDSPRPLCNRGGRVSRRCRQGANESKGETRGEWIPPELRLPDTIEEIERGRRTQQQGELSGPDDSREARLERLLSQVTFFCNRCNLTLPAPGFCPRCRCPEFRLEPAEIGRMLIKESFSRKKPVVCQ